MIFKNMYDCLDQYYQNREYTSDICISACNMEGEEESTQDGMQTKKEKKYISLKERQRLDQIPKMYIKQTISANMPVIFDYVDMCVDIERALNKRTNFEQKLIKICVIDDRISALDYMIEVYGCKNNCQSMNDLDCRLDEILYAIELDLREIGYIK